MPTDPEEELHRQSLVERRIREAMERGEFDDLPGSGQPIPDLDLTYDPDWWAKKWLRRQRVADAADELRRRLRRELPGLRASGDREQARRRLGELDAAIAAVNEQLPEGERIERLDLGDLRMPP